jgi:hypothetical protein
MINACSGASTLPFGAGMRSTMRSSNSSTPKPVLALMRTASIAAMPMMSSICVITRSGSAVGRSILLMTGRTSSPCSIAV